MFRVRLGLVDVLKDQVKAETGQRAMIAKQEARNVFSQSSKKAWMPVKLRQQA